MTVKTRPAEESSSSAIWKWTLTKESIAPCFVRDVLNMRSNDGADADFFWLGRVPCRSVRILGLVVGMQVYEKRTVYSVDDGTSVIDCFKRRSAVQASAKESGTENNGEPCPVPLTTPDTTVDVGCVVCVVGRVIQRHDSKQINVDSIKRCAASNEEPMHWETVILLHKTSYSLADPFVIPSSPPQPAAEPEAPSSPTTTINNDALRPQTPSSVESTPVTSPVKEPSLKRLPRLRHPSRLRSRELTANTFRIYIKYYMDNDQSNASLSFEGHSDSDTDSRLVSHCPSRSPLTPTKSFARANETTPSASKFVENTVDLTPKAPILSSRKGKATSHSSLQGDHTSPMRGFTLSYLRRVPELTDMARRVVHAEAKRREREERKRAKEGSKCAPRSGEPLTQEQVASKMERLFKWAIVKLYDEGSIILWDGPVQTCADMERASSISKVRETSPDELEVEVEWSDPPAQEEAYVLVTPAYLAAHVEKTIAAFMSRQSKSSAKREPQPWYSVPSPIGPTREEIATSMKRLDERWAHIGAWAVDEALEILKEEGRAWQVGGGRWELCV